MSNKQSRRRGKLLFDLAKRETDPRCEFPTEQTLVRALADLRALIADEWGLDFTKLNMEARSLYLKEKYA